MTEKTNILTRGLKRRMAGNVAANVYSLGAVMVIQFISVPLFLTHWSKERYGEWILLSAIPAYLSLAEAGFSTASANEVSMLISQGSLKEARRALHTAWGFLLGICSVLVPLAFLASVLLPWKSLLNLPDARLKIAETVFALSAFTLIGLAASIFGVIYRAAFRNPRIGFLTSTSRLLELCATALCVTRSDSIVNLSLVLLAARTSTTIAIYYDSTRIAPNLRLGLSEFSFGELKRIWRPSIMFLALSVGNALYFQGLTLLIGRSLGPIMVVTFNTTRALTRAIVQFVTVIKHSIWPEFSYLFGAGDLVRARRLFGLAVEITWVASVGLGVGLYFFAVKIMAVWTHRLVEIDNNLLGPLLLGAVLNSLWFVTSGLLQGINRHEGLAWRYLAATGGSVLLATLLVRLFGIAGAAWSMVACEAVLLPYAINTSCRLLDYTPHNLIAEALQLRQIAAFLRQNRIWSWAGPDQ